MLKTFITWRKANADELNNGSDEMIKVSEIQMDVPDEVAPSIDLSNIDINSLSDEQIAKLKQRLNL